MPSIAQLVAFKRKNNTRGFVKYIEIKQRFKFYTLRIKQLHTPTLGFVKEENN